MPKTESKTSNHPSISQKIKQLEADTEWFYSDDFSLDEAISKYQSAIELAAEIEQDLTELKNQVEVIADFTKD